MPALVLLELLQLVFEVLSRSLIFLRSLRLRTLLDPIATRCLHPCPSFFMLPCRTACALTLAYAFSINLALPSAYTCS